MSHSYLEIQIDVIVPEGCTAWSEEDDAKLGRLCDLAEEMWPGRWTMSGGITDGETYDERSAP